MGSEMCIRDSFQSEGSAPLVQNIIVKDPETIATAIRIGNPVNREKAKKVKKESKGDFQSVTDEEIINAYKILAKEEFFVNLQVRHQWQD